MSEETFQRFIDGIDGPGGEAQGVFTSTVHKVVPCGGRNGDRGAAAPVLPRPHFVAAPGPLPTLGRTCKHGPSTCTSRNKGIKDLRVV